MTREATKLNLQAELDRLTAAEGSERVPGIAVGILTDGRVETFTSGVASPAHASAVTADTLFRIASVTKLYTATLVMQLAGAGRIGLDDPVSSQLPGFRLADHTATAAITPRQLLCHTAGIPGDFGFDGGRGDDAVARYVAALAELYPIYRPGLLHSYSNAGYVVLGRLVEHVAGQTWDAALHQGLLRPLGLEHTVTLPEDVLVHRHAVGHTTDAVKGTVAPVTRWHANRASGPCGVISASVGDLLAFARLHLDTPYPEMFEPQVALPQGSHPQAWGFGFELSWDGDRLVPGHGGNTAGQTSALMLIPDRKAAVAFLANSDYGRLRLREVSRRLLLDRFGIDLADEPPRAPDPPPPVNLHRYLGSYPRVDQRLDVGHGDGGLELTITTTRSYVVGADPEPPLTLPMRPVREGVFLVHSPGAPTDVAVVFTEQNDGRTYLHLGLRATPRAEPEPP